MSEFVLPMTADVATSVMHPAGVLLDAEGNPVLDADGNPIFEENTS